MKSRLSNSIYPIMAAIQKAKETIYTKALCDFLN